jgi:predicted alpha/beta-fold hydrolase
MKSTLIGKEVYLRVMGGSMKQLVNNNKKEIKQYTKLDLEEIEKVTYLYEFDRAVQ